MSRFLYPVFQGNWCIQVKFRFNITGGPGIIQKALFSFRGMGI